MSISRKALASVALLAMTPSVALAIEGTFENTLQPMRDGNVTYLSGGIGDEERQAMESVQRNYNLHIMSASTSGAFVGDTLVSITDNRGNRVVNTEAGPLLYVELPPGAYTVRAESNGQVKEQKINVGSSAAKNLHFSWRNMG